MKPIVVMIAGLAVGMLALTGCPASSACPSFKQAVHTFTGGPGYKGAVARVQTDETMTATTRRIELMSLAGLQCTFDEDRKVSTAAAPSASCKCARPTSAEAGAADCDAWAKSVQ